MSWNHWDLSLRFDCPRDRSGDELVMNAAHQNTRRYSAALGMSIHISFDKETCYRTVHKKTGKCRAFDGFKEQVQRRPRL